MRVDLSLLGEEDRLILDKLRERGEAWIVGGWVRDFLSGISPMELDIATDLKPDEVAEIFPRSILVGEKYGTIGVRVDHPFHEDRVWEVTTLRKDGGYGDGRRPDNVNFGSSIEADLSRRDYTINSMAIDDAGNVIDPHGGIRDLDIGIIRCVGSPRDRIGEDGLRIIRAFRFMELGDKGLRDLDGELSKAISSNLSMIDKISRERVWSELKVILSGPNASSIIDTMRTHGVMDKILDGITHTEIFGNSTNYCVNLALMCRTDDSNGEKLSSLLKEKLKLTRQETADIKFLHECRGIDIVASKSMARVFRASLPESRQRDVLEYLSCMGREVSQFETILGSLSELRAGNSPLIDGNTLSAKTALKPGIRLGRLKGWLHRIQIEEDIHEKAQLISRLEGMDWEEGEPESWPFLSWP